MTFDMTGVTKAKTDQLNFDDLGTKSITVKITSIRGSDDPAQPVILNFENDGGKPFKPGLSMRRVLKGVWGKDGQQYVGKSLTLYGDPDVIFGKIKVGGIRISHMSDIKEPVTIFLTASKANKKPFTVKPLAVTEAPPQSVIDAGNAAAAAGVAAYTEWLATLAPEVKATVRSYHTAWTKAAKAVVTDEAVI